MKRIYYRKAPVLPILAVAFIGIIFTACRKVDGPVEVISNDTTKPDKISNVAVENLDGAAKITYTLPNSKNLLYVLATYAINDNRVRETKASYYTNTILVDGFARSKEYEVTLYAVSRANVKSDPVVIKVHPNMPNYQLVNAAVNITPDFGGANFFGLNPNKAPLALHMLIFNETTKRFEEQEPVYLTSDTIDLSIRNLPPTPHKFGIYTTDRFGNVSDTLIKTLTPLKESLLDKSKFATYSLPSDAPIGYGWNLSYFFDGNLTGNGWHTLSAPQTIGTFSMGVTAKISRFIVWQRPPEWYGYQNARKITLWGSNKNNPANMVPPNSSAPGTVVGDWVNMGNFVFPNPPSGLQPSQANEADKAFVAQGINFTMPRTAPEVKYIRYHVTQTWGGLDYVNAMEISIYGNPM